MSLNPISRNIVNLIAGPDSPVKSNSKQSAGASFNDIFSQSLENANQTDLKDKESAIELLSGTSDDMSGMLLDAQKAEISLQLALQLRNKAIEAYNEIMRMQI